MALAALGGCVSTATTVDSKWREYWAARSTRYQVEAQAADGQIGQQTASLLSASSKADALRDYFQFTFNRAAVHGRSAILEQYLAHLATEPPAGMSSTWFDDKARFLNAEHQSHRTRWNAYLEATSRDPWPADWFAQLVVLTVQRGFLTGTLDELNRTSGEAVNYLSDLATARRVDDERRARVTAGLLMMAGSLQAVGQSLQQQSYQQQMLRAVNRPITCRQIGAVVSCF